MERAKYHSEESPTKNPGRAVAFYASEILHFVQNDMGGRFRTDAGYLYSLECDDAICVVVDDHAIGEWFR